MNKNTGGSEVHASGQSPDCLRQTRGRYERAVAGLAGIAHRLGAVHFITDHRPAAVATNQYVAFGERAVGKVRDDTMLVLRKIGECPAEMNADGIVCKHYRARRTVEIRTMNLKMTGAVFRLIGLARRPAAQDFTCPMMPDLQFR